MENSQPANGHLLTTPKKMVSAIKGLHSLQRPAHAKEHYLGRRLKASGIISSIGYTIMEDNIRVSIKDRDDVRLFFRFPLSYKDSLSHLEEGDAFEAEGEITDVDVDGIMLKDSRPINGNIVSDPDSTPSSSVPAPPIVQIIGNHNTIAENKFVGHGHIETHEERNNLIKTKFPEVKKESSFFQQILIAIFSGTVVVIIAWYLSLNGNRY